MLTRDQLDNLNWKLIALKNKPSIPGSVVDDYELMLTEIKQLQTALTAKDHVLSQFANAGNWNIETTRTARRGYDSYVWDTATNPITFANQALSEGKE